MIWRVAGSRTLAAVTPSPTAGAVTLATPLQANVTAPTLTAAGSCAPGPCACNFTGGGACFPASLADGANVTCGFVCSPGTANVTVAAALNSHAVGTTIVATVAAANASSACASLAAPLLGARAYPVGAWSSPKTVCGGFSHDVETTRPPQGAGQCTSLHALNFTATSPASLAVGNATVAAANATALVPCKSPNAAVMELNYARLKQWQW